MLAAMLGTSAEARAADTKQDEPKITHADKKACDTSCAVPTLEKQVDKTAITKDLRNLKAEIEDVLPGSNDEDTLKKWEIAKADYIKQLDELVQSNPKLFEDDPDIFKLRRDIFRLIVKMPSQQQASL